MISLIVLKGKRSESMARAEKGTTDAVKRLFCKHVYIFQRKRKRRPSTGKQRNVLCFGIHTAFSDKHRY